MPKINKQVTKKYESSATNYKLLYMTTILAETAPECIRKHENVKIIANTIKHYFV